MYLYVQGGSKKAILVQPCTRIRSKENKTTYPILASGNCRQVSNTCACSDNFDSLCP